MPPDVAALVSSVENDGLTLTLCNLHVHKRRSLILQGGAFGEHNITAIETGTYTQRLTADGCALN